MNHADTNRIIGFDLLRVIMVLLLIVFHAGVSFMVTPLDAQVWEYQDRSTNILFDGTLSFIHTFRHPTFFLISGFLTAQMLNRYSTRDVMLKRIKRLLIPLAIVAIIFGPFINGTLSLINGNQHPFSWNEMFLIQGDQSINFGTSYVWFLYYLFLFSTIHLTIKAAFNPILKSYKSNFRKVLWIVVFLILTTCLSLFWWKENTLFGQYYLIPHPGSLFGYFSFYLFGAYMAGLPNVIDTLRQRKFHLIMLTIGLGALGTYMSLGHQQIVSGKNMIDFDLSTMFLSSIATVTVSLGGIGIACRQYKRSISMVLFLSKSSYFIYLVHFPVILLNMVLVMPLKMNCFLKFIFILVPTLGISLFLNFIWVKAWKNKPPI